MLRSKLLAFDDRGAATNAWPRTVQAHHELDEILSSFNRAAEKAPCSPMMSAPMLFEALDRILHRRRTFNEPRVPTLGQASSFNLHCEGSSYISAPVTACRRCLKISGSTLN